MAVSIKDIQKLREMTGAGLADCKKALEESNGEIEPAVEIIRKKGQAVAAKRSDREASEGCVVVKADGNFAAIIALKCETDFVANNADFVKLTQDILDAAVAARCKTLDEVKALTMGDSTIQDAVVARSGITGEKMELDGYCVIEGEYIATYDHQGKHTLCTMVALNKAVEDATVGKNVAMQIASASPVAIDETSVPQEVKEARAAELMAIQQEISGELMQRFVGKTEKVIIDREEGGYFIGRTQYDSPEVDCEVLIEKTQECNLRTGEFYDVKINRAEEFDLYGKVRIEN